MGARQAVLLTPSKSSGPTQLLSYKQKASVTPLFATLTSRPQITENPATLSPFPATLTTPPPVTPVFATLTKTAGVSLLRFLLWKAPSATLSLGALAFNIPPPCLLLPPPLLAPLTTLYRTISVAISAPEEYCAKSAPSRSTHRSNPSAPPNEMMTTITFFVPAVTIVRSESLVGLPCGPRASQNTGNPSRFKSYFPIPLYVSPARPARNTISPLTCSRSYNPTGSRLSTETRLITSTTALISGNPFPAITLRNNASADPRYL